MQMIPGETEISSVAIKIISAGYQSHFQTHQIHSHVDTER